MPGRRGSGPHPPLSMSIGSDNSSWSRAGLLQARSYHAPSPLNTPSSLVPSLGAPAQNQSHTQDNIRLDTVHLSDLNMGESRYTSTSPSFISPISEEFEQQEYDSEQTTPRISLHTPSGLSLQLSRHLNRPEARVFSPDTPPIESDMSTSPVPWLRGHSPSIHQINTAPLPPPPRNIPQRQSSVKFTSPPSVSPEADERTSLLHHPTPNVNGYGVNECGQGKAPETSSWVTRAWKHACPPSKQGIKNVGKSCLQSIPAVILGGLLNILDGVSYGMIIFPATGIFAGKGGLGVSMFFVTCVISQLTYTLGGSGFAGANGSMMIEVVPFFHILASSIAASISNIDDVSRADEIMATTLVAFALSSVLTGLAFLLLGALKLGAVIGFFPRHILVGCIGGVGLFLIETGFAVSLRIPDDDFNYNWEMVKFMTDNARIIALWTIPLALAILLRVITSKFRHQLIFPAYFLIIPIVFYIIVAAGQMNLSSLRADGWVFDMGDTSDDAWWTFYTLFDFKKVHWMAIWESMPTQFALLLFNILHPPLNVPALSVSLDEDVDTDKELVAHGYSNLIAGVLGTVPNYLVYVNTLLFYRVGGDTRIAGFMLVLVNVALLMLGSGPIAYLPVIVVSALIFVLGIDLVKEALWDTRHRVSWTEYVTIISIMLAMTIWDFVTGVLFGIIVCCVFFVAQNSQRKSIRSMHTGDSSMSTVRRPGSQRAYLREVTKQTSILRLQGFLFFGTIASVEDTIRSLITGPLYNRNPVRFLVLDLTLVAGVDMSAAEAFVRIQRLLHARSVILVLCGFTVDNTTGKALDCVGVLNAPGVELFHTFNDAMEWTENAYLRAWFRSQKKEVVPVALPRRQDGELQFSSSMARSPRLAHIRDVGNRTIASEILSDDESSAPAHPEPYDTLVKTFSSYDSIDPTTISTLSSYFTRLPLPQGYTLFSQGDDSDGLYVIESGVLRASYAFAAHIGRIEESMVPFTLAGELSFVSQTKRNASVVVERQAVVWKVDREGLKRMESEHPDVAKVFLTYVLKAAKFDTDILLSALATRQ